MMPRTPSNRPTRAHGLTLLELMVALVISAIVAAGALQIFQSSRGAFRLNEALARIQENGRFAMDFLQRDLRLAASTGCFEPTAGGPPFSQLSDQTGAGPPNFNGALIAGVDSDGNAPARPAGLAARPDSLTIRGVAPQPQVDTTLTADMTTVGDNLQVASAANIDAGDFLMIADCISADVFQAQNGTSPINTGANLGRPYDAGASVVSAREVTYRVRVDDRGTPADTSDDVPFLERVINGNAQRLIDNVADFQVLAGENTDPGGAGTGPPTPPTFVPNRYVPFGTTGLDAAQIRSVRIRVTVRSAEEAVVEAPVQRNLDGNYATQETATDRRLYQMYTITPALRNRLP